MELQTILSIASTLAGLIGFWKIRHELINGRRSNLREEYRFSREFLAEVERKADMHPFIKQKGYQAIAGDTRLAAAEFEYLISLAEPAYALRLYVMGRTYLEHNTTAVNRRITFKRRYRTLVSRLLEKSKYFALYVAFYGIGALPAFHWPLSLTGVVPSTSTTLLLVLVCWPMSFVALRLGMRVNAAEKLVKMQL